VSHAKKHTGNASAPAYCRPAKEFFERHQIPDGDDALAALGPKGGDCLIAEISSDVKADDLVVVWRDGRTYYGFYRPLNDAGRFRLEYGAGLRGRARREGVRRQ